MNGTRLIEQSNGTDTLHFNYDRNGEAIGFTHFYSGEENAPIMCEYVYVKNAQGDVVGIYNSLGDLKVSYTYDPWGKLLSVESDFGQYERDVSLLNPFRYRGYYYDNETELYYLQSRYYDPEVGRFINCDDVNYIGATGSEVSYNPFAYCENNPVNYEDSNGYASRKMLNKIFENYKIGLFGISELFASLALLNSGNAYLAFHELVQVIVATELYWAGRLMSIELEKPCEKNKRREIDIWGYEDKRHNGINYIWEVKPYGQKSAAHKRINEYLKLNDNFKNGYKFGTIVKQILDNKLSVKITSDAKGGVYYAFYNGKGKRITNSELYSKVKKATNLFWASIAGTVALIAGGIALIIYTGGSAAPTVASTGGKILAFATSSTANSIGEAAMIALIFLGIYSKL